MKLIDLLVQELPKRGGWPEGADCCCVSGVDSDGVTIQFRFIPRNNQFLFCPDADHLDIPYQGDTTEFITCEVITKEMYQSALAASQKPAWNGEGVPPVGCECEYSLNAGKTWWKCKIDYIVGTQGVVMLCDTFEGVQYVKFLSYGGALKFRPIRTEAERKREVAIEAILSDMRTIPCDLSLRDEVAVIYDAIAAGKIPGVKLDD